MEEQKCRVRQETRSQVLGSWNKKARANSSLNRVKEAAVVAVLTVRNKRRSPYFSVPLIRASSPLALSVLLGVCLGFLGVFRCVFILVRRKAILNV